MFTIADFFKFNWWHSLAKHILADNVLSLSYEEELTLLLLLFFIYKEEELT